MTLLIGDLEPGFRGIMKSCNWNVSHLEDPPYSTVLTDEGEYADSDEIKNNDECNVADNDSSNNVMANEEVMDERSGSIVNNTCISMNLKDTKKGMKEDMKKDPISECRVFLVGGVTRTGDICVPDNLNSLERLLQRELPVSCESKRSERYDDRQLDDGTKGAPRGQTKSYENSENSENNENSGNSEKKENGSAESCKIRKFVDFVCSDGFDHETEAFRIVLGQVIGMIKTLKMGGNFIMKVFSCTKVRFVLLIVALLIVALLIVVIYGDMTSYSYFSRYCYPTIITHIFPSDSAIDPRSTH